MCYDPLGYNSSGTDIETCVFPNVIEQEFYYHEGKYYLKELTIRASRAMNKKLFYTLWNDNLNRTNCFFS